MLTEQSSPRPEEPTASVPQGYFRTPLAAGLLTGALAGGVSILLTEVYARCLREMMLNESMGSYFEQKLWAFQILITLPGIYLQCLGPAICRRDARLILAGVPWVLVIGLVGLLPIFLIYTVWQFTGHHRFWINAVFWTGPEILRVVLLTLALSRLYGLRRFPRQASLFGTAVVIVIALIWAVLQPDYTDDGTTPVRVMSMLVSHTALVAAITLGVDMELKRKAVGFARSEQVENALDH